MPTFASGDSFMTWLRHKADYIIANPHSTLATGAKDSTARYSLEIRRTAKRQRQLRLDTAHDPPPLAKRHRRIRTVKQRYGSQSSGEGGFAKNSLRPTWSMQSSHYRVSYSSIPVFRLVYGLCRAIAQIVALQDALVDGRNLGKMINRRNRELTEDDIAQVAKAYHDFKRKTAHPRRYRRFCKSRHARRDQEHDYVLTPGPSQSSEEVEENDEAFADKMERLTAELHEQFAKSLASSENQTNPENHEADA